MKKNGQIATDVFCRKQITPGALPVCDSAVETEYTRVCVVHSDLFIPIHFLFEPPMRQVENANATCETRMDPWITFRKLTLLVLTKRVNDLWSRGNMNMFCPQQTEAPNPIFWYVVYYLNVFRCSKPQMECRIVLSVVELVYLALDTSIQRSFFFFWSHFPQNLHFFYLVHKCAPRLKVLDADVFRAKNFPPTSE